MDFPDGCAALITGASAGIGREIARQLAGRAHTLVLVARRAERLEQLREELASSNHELNIHCLTIDLVDSGAVDAVLNFLQQNNLTINLLVNNAGLGDHGEFRTSDWTRVKQIIGVNIAALTHLTHALLPMLCGRERAAILNVSSIAGFAPVPGMAVYAATKAYVTSFSEALRSELSGTGVCVTVLCPGPVETEFGRVARRREGGNLMSPPFLKVSVEKVAASALAAVARGKPRAIPGWHVALLAAAMVLTPMPLLRFCLKRYRRVEKY